MKTQLQQVYYLVKTYPGLTATELSDLVLGDSWSLDNYARVCQVRRRLSDLRDKNVKINGRRNGESCWHLVP